MVKRPRKGNVAWRNMVIPNSICYYGITQLYNYKVGEGEICIGASVKMERFRDLHTKDSAFRCTLNLIVTRT